MGGREFCGDQIWVVPVEGFVPMECASRGDTTIAWGPGCQGWRDTVHLHITAELEGYSSTRHISPVFGDNFLAKV